VQFQDIRPAGRPRNHCTDRKGDAHVRYRVSIEHHEIYVIDASCAAEAQFIAADFATNRNNSEYTEHVLEHSDESLRYECTQLEACLHAPTLDEDQVDA
jgi:hypothetical protein